MIRKLIQHINEWLEYGLRGLLGRLTPDRRVILIVTMLLVFSGLSIYMTVSSIYNIGKNDGEQIKLKHIESLKKELEQRQTDSINNLKNKYEYERRYE